jgi:hypothetical protein
VAIQLKTTGASGLTPRGVERWLTLKSDNSTCADAINGKSNNRKIDNLFILLSF